MRVSICVHLKGPYYTHQLPMGAGYCPWVGYTDQIVWNVHGEERLASPCSHQCPPIYKLKADRPHPRNYPHTPTDHRHTDKHFRLVTTLLCSKLAVWLFAALGKAEPPISTAANQKFDPDPSPWPVTLTSTFDLDPWPLTLTLKQCNSDANTRFLTFDLDLWPTTLTYIPSLA